MSGEERESPRRLRAGDVIEQQQAALMAALTRTSGQGATVELSQNAKGDTQIGVKVSDDDAATAERLCREIYDRLREAYPRGVA